MSTSTLLLTRHQSLELKAGVDRKVVCPTDKGSISITQVRELIRWTSLKPYQSQEKVAVIQQAESLTIEAQNCLLKTLEEPPQNTHLFLVARRQDSFLPTVLSRCQIVHWEKDTTLKVFFSDVAAVKAAVPVVAVDEFLGQLTSPLPQVFKYIEKLTQKLSRPELTGLLEQTVRSLHQEFQQTRTPRDLQTAALLEKTKRDIVRQANSRLALENLALSLKH